MRRVRSDRWELEANPERGGRITSLRLDGEELLDQGIGVDQPTADGFVEGGAWGWDEMVPNVERTESLPDHGEAWRLKWQVMRAAGIELAMRCRGRILPWELSRSVYLRDSVIVLYTYRNIGRQPHPAYWCAHPLFKFEPGMSISLVEGERLAGLAEGTSTKLHLPRGSTDHVRLGWSSGTAIEVRWDPEKTPYVGVWACNGDLGGYRQIAIEPATGGGDRPTADMPAPMLGPGAQLSWALEVRPVT